MVASLPGFTAFHLSMRVWFCCCCFMWLLRHSLEVGISAPRMPPPPPARGTGLSWHKASRTVDLVPMALTSGVGLLVSSFSVEERPSRVTWGGSQGRKAEKGVWPGVHVCTWAHSNTMIFLGSAAHGQFSSTEENQTNPPGNRNCQPHLHMAFLGTGWSVALFCLQLHPALLFLAPRRLSSPLRFQAGACQFQEQRDKSCPSSLWYEHATLQVFPDLAAGLLLGDWQRDWTGPSRAFCSKRQEGGSREWAFTTGRKFVSSALRIPGA